MSCITSCSTCPSRGGCSIKKTGSEKSQVEEQFKEKRVIVIMSGKGGVGKSTISGSIAVQISRVSKTCIIDADISGASIARVTGCESSQVIAEKLLPVRTGSLDVFTPESTGGVQKGSEFLNYLESISVEEYETVVIDTPPGTSDIHIALSKHLPNMQVVLVSTPHKLSIADTNRQISFCRKAGLEIIAVVENMSGYECSSCHFLIETERRYFLDIDKSVLRLAVPMSQKIAKECDSGILEEIEKYVKIESLKIFNNAGGKQRTEPVGASET